MIVLCSVQRSDLRILGGYAIDLRGSRYPQGVPQGRLILAGVPWVTSLGLGVRVGYNWETLIQVYPVISGLSGVTKPRRGPCLVRQGVARIPQSDPESN